MKNLEKMLSSFIHESNLKVPSFDELKSYLQTLEKSKLIELVVNGKSKNGREIFFVKLGVGSNNVAITGGAHSDEPIGIATCFYFIKNLAENSELKTLKEEFTFLIHPCLDPDGAVLNYSWANSSFYPDYLLKNFRNNDPSNDVEHGIPVKESQTIRPELETLMSNLLPYKNRLAFYVTLHTTHTTGGSMVLLYGEKKIDDMVSSFSKKAIELECPMADYRPKAEERLGYIAPGFMKSPSYNDFKEMLKDNLSLLDGYKMTTYEWASIELHAPLCLIAEFPFYLDELINDNSPSSINYIEFLKESLEFNKSIYHKVCSSLQNAEKFNLDKTSPWYKKAVTYRDNALKSFQKDDKYFEQFSGVKATLGELHYRPMEKIESEMKSHILTYNLLKNIPEAKNEFEAALRKFKEFEGEWLKIATGKILTIEAQLKLQLAMILSGLMEL